MNKPTKDRKMTRARAIEMLKRESGWYRQVFGKYDRTADALDLAVADMEKIRRRQKLMKRDLIRHAKARKEAAR